MFLYKLTPGRPALSFGVHVARLCGVEEGVLLRAHEVVDAQASVVPRLSRCERVVYLAALPRTSAQCLCIRSSMALKLDAAQPLTRSGAMLLQRLPRPFCTASMYTPRISTPSA